MKIFKKGLSLFLAAVSILLCFSGCSKPETTDVITDKTMLIAYTRENAPFVYTNEDGELDGFDVSVFKKIFKDIKNDYENYYFIMVDEDYRVGEDVAYTDEEGNEYIAYVMIGGIARNTGSLNKDVTFSENVIDNRVITITNQDSAIKTYADLAGARVGVVTDTAMTALDKNTVIKNGMKSVNQYENAEEALADLTGGKLDAVVIDEFTFNVNENKDSFAVLGGELDKISYAYAFKKNDWWADSINEAVFELKSEEYNDADELTPIVEEYFGYNASNFDYNAVEK